jgi:glyoxylase-like metal-dependent hydrolase (beta-lactamase superfamily II)
MIREVWPASVARSQANLDSGQVPAELVPDIRGDIETRRRTEALRPDVPVTATGPRMIDGLALELHLAPNAATETDVWVYAPRSRIVAVGDLVTLPVPFLDTACVKGWRDALEQVAATPFETLVPGHGATMNRSQFGSYRNAFLGYTACAAASEPAASCAVQWLQATSGLRAPEAAADARAREMAEEYVDVLRASGGNGLRCRE